MSKQICECIEEQVKSENQHIQAYKLSVLMKTASKITDLLTKNAEITMNYNEINLILKVVKMAVSEAEGDKRNECL